MAQQEAHQLEEELKAEAKDIDAIVDDLQEVIRHNELPAMIALIWKKLNRLVVQQQDLRQQLSTLQEKLTASPSTRMAQQELSRQLGQMEQRIEEQDAKIEEAKNNGEPEDVSRYEGNRKRLDEKEKDLRQKLSTPQASQLSPTTEGRALSHAHALAQQEIEWLKEQWRQWEQRIVEQQEKIVDAIEEEMPEKVITIHKEEKDRLVKEKDDRWQQLCVLQARLVSPAGDTNENILPTLLKSVEQKFTEMMGQMTSKLQGAPLGPPQISGTCDMPDKPTGQGTKRQRESEEAAKGSDDQYNDGIDFESAEWQARENAFHENLVELLRHPSIYRGLGLSGPPDTIQHATLKERLNTMKVVLPRRV